MKKLATVTAAAIIMASCGGGGGNEFASVGKPIDLKKMTLDEPKKAGADSPIAKLTEQVRSSTQRMSQVKKTECDYPIQYFWNKKDNKKGFAIDDKVAVPALFHAIRIFNCEQSLFIVEKDGKLGMVQAFKNGFVAPCEYSEIDADLHRRLLYLNRPDAGYETYSLDTGKKWDGKENWPPKKFPVEIPVKDLTGFPNWKIETLNCTRTGAVTTLGRIQSEGAGFRFTMKGVGLKNWNWSPATGWDYHSYEVYIETEDGKLVRQEVKTYPNVKEGQPLEISFVIDDSSLQNVNSLSIVVKNRGR